MARHPTARPSRLLVNDRLLEKYRKSVQKYEELVRRYAEHVSGKASAVTLALAALRASRTGHALLGREGFVTRNPRWIELARREAPWTLVMEPEGSSEPDLDAPVLRGTRALLREPAGTSLARRYQRSGGAQLVDLRLERVNVGRRALVIAFAEDVSERAAVERALSEARASMVDHERMRALGELASGVAHDLNNTLHALTLRIERLRADPAVLAAHAANVEALSRIVRDAATRVSRLQEFARRREDVPTGAFDVAKVLREAVEIARPEILERSKLQGLRVDVEVDAPEGLFAVGETGEVRHLFLNLLMNARDAMPQGGRVRVTASRREDSVVVGVEDEGTGIAPEHLDRIFDPFFTTKGRKGMGLGLAIAQGVMRRLGGSIRAQNRDGGGAAVTATFPSAPAPSVEAAPRPPAALGRGHRVLVVEDDEDNLEAMRQVLEDLGQEFAAAPTARRALELARNGALYDAVVCDVGLPDMNGWALARELRRLLPGARILILSGWAAEVPPDDPRRRLVSAVLGKPLATERLAQALAEALATPPAANDPADAGDAPA